ncbi:hypothetical protein [Bradyrhizobium sp. Ec3.3]|uniref:hypothetical protein n=1 Tax=Bradyrhizobium sp. Ec3.3 TaxID=189753 RepID=UPI000400E33C
MTDRGWGRPFDDPIEIGGRKLVTLREAGEYIAALPPKVHDAPEWQAAMEGLILVVEQGGPTMFARIGIMRAPRKTKSRCSGEAQASQEIQGYPMNRMGRRTIYAMLAIVVLLLIWQFFASL